MAQALVAREAETTAELLESSSIQESTSLPSDITSRAVRASTKARRRMAKLLKTHGMSFSTGKAQTGREKCIGLNTLADSDLSPKRRIILLPVEAKCKQDVGLTQPEVFRASNFSDNKRIFAAP